MSLGKAEKVFKEGGRQRAYIRKLGAVYRIKDGRASPHAGTRELEVRAPQFFRGATRRGFRRPPLIYCLLAASAFFCFSIYPPCAAARLAKRCCSRAFSMGSSPGARSMFLSLARWAMQAICSASFG